MALCQAFIITNYHTIALDVPAVVIAALMHRLELRSTQCTQHKACARCTVHLFVREMMMTSWWMGVILCAWFNKCKLNQNEVSA